MAGFSYSGDPLSSPQDEVRFLLGDTDDTDPQLLDREIEYLLRNQSNVYIAAANGARAIAGRYARLVDKSVGDLRLSYSQRQKQYFDLATTLETRAFSVLSATDGMPYAGGISRADKLGVEQDTDRDAPGFRVGMHNIPGDED